MCQWLGSDGWESFLFWTKQSKWRPTFVCGHVPVFMFHHAPNRNFYHAAAKRNPDYFTNNDTPNAVPDPGGLRK